MKQSYRPETEATFHVNNAFKTENTKKLIKKV